MKFVVTALLFAALSSPTQASTTIYPTFAPENDLYVDVNQRGGITEDEFNFVTSKLEELYAPIFAEKGGKLVMVNDWQDGTVNAYTQRIGVNWQVHMFGGLARYGEMTMEGFAAVICHEYGHQIGGLPKKKSFWGSVSWASAEGQSDYFSTAKCLKKLFLATGDNQEVVAQMDVPLVASNACSEVYSDPEELAICIRSAMAGRTLGRTLASMGAEAMPSLDTPSSLVVSKTNLSGYPSSQCRMDTYFQGALCDQSASINPTDDAIHEGYCARENGYEIGVRPLCWYNPTDPNNLNK